MNKETQELISFLNSLSSAKENVGYINAIYNIVGFMESGDINNGQNYLNTLLADQKIYQYVRFRNEEGGTMMRLDALTNFVSNCNEIIRAISIYLSVESLKEEFKNSLRPDLKSFAELLQFFKDKVNRN